MSETVADELGALRWDPTSALAVPDASDQWQAAPTLGFSELPVIRRGQLWFVELPESGPGLAPFEYGGLTTANIVVYDPALAPAVARHLPLGSYAEPAASNGVASERCIRFARNGWSVARLLHPRIRSGWEQLDRMRQLSQELLALKTPADLPIQIFVARGSGRYEKNEARVDRLDAEIAAHASAISSTFIIILDVTEAVDAPRFSIASANGLAG
jgi:hypothetical protein